jgi:hypothetical protein
MTSRQIFDYALVELNKREAPSLLLEDYNYFINKAINQYINKMYNAYDVNQQKSDDLRVLKSTAILTPTLNNDYGTSALFNKVYEVDLPDDYLHILNCVVEYLLESNYKCYNQGSYWQQGAKRLTGDMFSQIINNYYLRPTYKNPYFYINNVNTQNLYPTSDTQQSVFKYKIVINCTSVTIGSTIVVSDDTNSVPVITFTLGDEFEEVDSSHYVIPNDIVSINKQLNNICNLNGFISGNFITLYTNKENLDITKTGSTAYKTPNEVPIMQQGNARYGNSSKVRMEIRYGKDDSVFKLKKVYVDYLKAPQFVRLTPEQVDDVADNSQVLEFPDYVCQEIVNELIKLLMENASDPRLQTHIPINQSIAMPGQEQKK